MIIKTFSDVLWKTRNQSFIRLILLEEHSVKLAAKHTYMYVCSIYWNLLHVSYRILFHFWQCLKSHNSDISNKCMGVNNFFFVRGQCAISVSTFVSSMKLIHWSGKVWSSNWKLYFCANDCSIAAIAGKLCLTQSKHFTI